MTLDPIAQWWPFFLFFWGRVPFKLNQPGKGRPFLAWKSTGHLRIGPSNQRPTARVAGLPRSGALARAFFVLFFARGGTEPSRRWVERPYVLSPHAS